jgi:hypothetical protein
MKTKSGAYKKPSLKEKVLMYEALFNEIYICRNYSLNNDRILEILKNLDDFGRAKGSDGPYAGEKRSYNDYVYGSFWNLLKRMH